MSELQIKWWWPPQGTNGRLVIDSLGKLVGIWSVTVIVFVADADGALGPPVPLWWTLSVGAFAVFITILVCLYTYERFSWGDNE